MDEQRAQRERRRWIERNADMAMPGRDHLAGTQVVVWRTTANGAHGDRDAPNTGLIRELDRRGGPRAWPATAAMDVGDLLVVHRAGAHGKVMRDLLEVRSHPHTDRTAGDWSDRVLEVFVFVRVVANLRAGVTSDDWRDQPSLRSSRHRRARLGGTAAMTDVWPVIHGLLVERNRTAGRRLSPWAPA